MTGRAITEEGLAELQAQAEAVFPNALEVKVRELLTAPGLVEILARRNDRVMRFTLTPDYEKDRPWEMPPVQDWRIGPDVDLEEIERVFGKSAAS